jgi:hypothetical protein
MGLHLDPSQGVAFHTPAESVIETADGKRFEIHELHGSLEIGGRGLAHREHPRGGGGRVTEQIAQVHAVADLVRGFRFHYGDEDQLQEGLASALQSRGLEVQREVRLTARDRIDLLVERVGVEVKVAGRPDGVVRQLRRYAASDQVDGLVLVTNRVRHLAVPDRLNDKPVVAVTLAGGGL